MKLITNGNSIFLLLLMVFFSSTIQGEEYVHKKAIDDFLSKNPPTTRADNENKFKIIDDNILRLTQKYINNGCEEAADEAIRLARVFKYQHIEIEAVKNRMHLLRNADYFYKYGAFVTHPEGGGSFALGDTLEKLKSENNSVSYVEWKYVEKFGLNHTSWYHAAHPPHDFSERDPFLKRTLIPQALETGDATVFFKSRTRHDYGRANLVFEEDFIYADDIPTKNADEEELKKMNKGIREFYVNLENKIKKEVTDFLINGKCASNYALYPEEKAPNVYFKLLPAPYFGVTDGKVVLDLLEKIIGADNVITIFPAIAKSAANKLKNVNAGGAYGLSKINQIDSVDMIERYKITAKEGSEYFISNQMIRDYLLERRLRLYQMELMSHYAIEMINSFPFFEYVDPVLQKARVEKNQRMLKLVWKSI